MRFSHYAMSLFFLAATLPPVLNAQEKPSSEGAQLFSTNCAACHGSDGHGGERAPSIATLRSVISLSDSDLEAIVGKGVPSAGMPGFGFLGDQKVHDVVAYLRILQGRGPEIKPSGDPQSGRALFYGKAQCSKCHMVHGEGGFIAADLSTYGSGLSPNAVKQAILKPDLDLEQASKVVEIDTADGQHLSGLLRAEDNFTVYLQTEDGRYYTFSKAKLKDVRHTDHSIMPTDYEAKLSSKELEDLINFLITTASTSNPSEPPVKRRRHHED
jgi:cytochrome c oxidase cbb3-type subunit III